MHQALVGLPKQAVIDTNVLLNACFVSDGSAAYAIAQLSALGFIGVIDGAIEQEAAAILHRLRVKLALGFNPLVILESYMRQAKIMLLPRAVRRLTPNVNRADQHVYSAAQHYGAWILTGDIKLAAESQVLSVPVRLPWDVLIEVAIRNKKEIPGNYVCRFIGISPTEGFLFGRVIPGPWAGPARVGRFTVCEVEHVARLLYDLEALQWVFAVAGLHEARVSCRLTHGEHWAVCGSYKLHNGHGNASIRAFSTNGSTVHASISMNAVSFPGGPTGASFGHSVAGTDYWNGYLRTIVIAPKPMTNDTWGALRQIPESAPDPASGNVLEAALRKVRIVNGITRVPGEFELSHSWI